MIGIIFCVYQSNAIQCDLDGSNCRFSGVITTEFDKLFHPNSNNKVRVEHLEFSNSSMHTFTNEICHTFPNLRYLKAENLAVQQIQQLPKLSVLYLSENNLTDLNVLELLKNFPSLRTITLNYNLFDCTDLEFRIQMLRNNNVTVEVPDADIYEKRSRNLTMVDGIEGIREDEQIKTVMIQQSKIIQTLQNNVNHLREQHVREKQKLKQKTRQT